jgi:hypothetical protein
MVTGTFRAGVGRVDITPPLTAPHSNWGAQVHILPDGIETNLWATALVVDDGSTTAAWIDLDLMIISRPQADAIRAAVGDALGILAKSVRVSVTHSHAGPPPNAWTWLRQGQAALDAYYDLLPEYCAGAARAAMVAMRPAKLALGSGESRVAVNRRERHKDGRIVTGVNFDGVMDPQVYVVRIDGEDDTPIAAVVGYTMHPTTLGPLNRLVSADWPGHLKRTVESLTGATCLFAQGATGNVGPGPEGFTDRVEVIRKLGNQIACEVVQTYLSLHLPPVTFRHERVWESGAPLSVWKAEPVAAPPVVVRADSRMVDLPIRELPTLDEARAAVDRIQAKLDELRAANASASEIEAATFVAKRAYMTMNRVETYGGKATSAIELHLMQIGPAVLVGMEGEPFVEIGLEIKRRSPFPGTWFGGYTAGWAGYLPVADAYPDRGYEVDITPFAPTGANALIDAAVAALNDLANA